MEGERENEGGRRRGRENEGVGGGGERGRLSERKIGRERLVEGRRRAIGEVWRISS